MPWVNMLCPFTAGAQEGEHPNEVPHIIPGQRPG